MSPDASCDAAIGVLVLGWLPLGVGLFLVLLAVLGLRRDIDQLNAVMRDRWRTEDTYATLRQRFPKPGAG